MKIFLVAIALLVGVSKQAENLEFVFEIVRHGARAPLIAADVGRFKVPPGMLTSQGARQRYLLGYTEKKRYVEDMNFVQEAYLPTQVFI